MCFSVHSVDDQQVEQVSQFKYLESWFSDDATIGKCDGQDIVHVQEKILTDKLNCERIIKSTVCSRDLDVDYSK